MSENEHNILWDFVGFLSLILCVSLKTHSKKKKHVKLSYFLASIRFIDSTSLPLLILYSSVLFGAQGAAALCQPDGWRCHFYCSVFMLQMHCKALSALSHSPYLMFTNVHFKYQTYFTSYDSVDSFVFTLWICVCVWQELSHRQFSGGRCVCVWCSQIHHQNWKRT